MYCGSSVFPTGETTITLTPSITTTVTETLTPTLTLTVTPTSGKIIINEIQPNGDVDKDWIEIFNSGGSEIDVSGWTITDANTSDTLPTVTPIPPGGYAVIVASGHTVVGIPSSAITIQLDNTSIGNGLAVAGDRVLLLNNSTNMDQISYGSNVSVFPSPPNAPTASHSIRRIPNGVDTDTAADWSNGLPSIGVAN